MPLNGPDSEKGAGQGAPNSQTAALNASEYADAVLDRQARRILELYVFRPATARLIAAHAYRVRP